MTNVSFILLRTRAGNTMDSYRPFLGGEMISFVTGVVRRLCHVTGHTDLPGKELFYAYDVQKYFQTPEANLNPSQRNKS